MLILGLAIAAFSYGNVSDLSTTAAACCCCSGDSCPMKNKDASGKQAKSCCNDCDCCKGDDASCPMMKKDADGKAMKMDDAKDCPMMKKDDASATAAKTDGEVSCPMMKKDADGKPMKMDNADATSGMHMKHDMKMDGKDCPCCHKGKDKEKPAAPAV